MTALAQTLHLDASLHDVWGDWAAGRISDAEAAYRATLLEQQRPARLANNAGLLRLQPIRATPTIRRFAPRRYQRSPDKSESRRRRRELACRADMPPRLGRDYTDAERAVLTIIATEVRHHGYCDLHVDTIAAKAGVCRSMVIITRKKAVHASDISWKERTTPGGKSKTNIIRIIKAEWLDWISRKPSIGGRPPGIAVGCKSKFSHPTRKSIQKEKPRPQPVEREHGIRLECG